MRLHIKFLNLIVFAVLAGAFAKGFSEGAGEAIPYFLSSIRDLGGRSEAEQADPDEFKSMIASNLQGHGFPLAPDPDRTIEAVRRSLRGAFRDALVAVYGSTSGGWRGRVIGGFGRLDSAWRNNGLSIYDVYRKQAAEEKRYGGGADQKQLAAKRLYKIVVSMQECRGELRQEAVRRGLDESAVPADMN